MALTIESGDAASSAPGRPGMLENIREVWADRTAFKVLVLCAAVAFLDGVDTQLVAGFAPVISNAFGIKIAQFSLVFSAGLFGMMVGSLIFGSLADRFGRKLMIVASMLIFSGGTVATAFGGTLGYFVFIRFVTGLGIGGALPNLLALTAEYAPARARVFVMSAMYCGYPLGGVAFGLVGSLLVHAVAWHMAFLLCGLLSLLFALPVGLFLPESRELRSVRTAADPPAGSRIASLFSDGRAIQTLLLWAAMFMTLMIILFTVSWINALLVRNGVPISSAILYPAFFAFGGILGGVLIGGLMDRYPAERVLAIVLTIGAVALGSMFWTVNKPALLFVSTLIAGMMIAGGQIGLQSVAATLYPPAVRSTGVGWALGIGRIGSFIGPLIGGALLAVQWPSSAILAIMGIPALLAAVALILLERNTARSPRN